MNWEPAARLKTHDVTNQSKPFGDLDLFGTDTCLTQAVVPHLAQAELEHLGDFGRKIGSHSVQELAEDANKNPPVLKSFDRFGHRLDEVAFHPAYHDLMDIGLSAGIASRGWSGGQGHLMHSALMYLNTAADVGVCCPMSMTYAGVSVLRRHPAGSPWTEKIMAGTYDRNFLPLPQKSSATIGMAMTEKQGGSDVRANTTTAEQTSDGWRLTGHKWFCSAPMCDAFLTLAQTANGLTCFLVPRWRKDGGTSWVRNEMHIMRLKDKMGDRSNASSEVEYHGAHAQILGEEGTGIRTIIEMVQHTRLDCAVISAGSMRTTLARALWHVQHRSAFQRRLIDQPAMRRVLADLALEVEAATALSMRLARAFDSSDDAQEAAFARFATPVAKYWICKRQPGFDYETLECFGGVGFVEEHAMARYFRTSPLNAIWEGSGNVMGLDVLRAMTREPDAISIFLSEVEKAKGNNANLDRTIEDLKAELNEPIGLESRMRYVTELMALTLQGSLLLRHAPTAVSDAFCASRLAPRYRGAFGTLPSGIDLDAIIERALPR